MARLTVVEFVRDPDAVWNLPAHLVEELRAGFPDVTFHSPRDLAGVSEVLPEADVAFGGAVRASNFALARRLRWLHVSAAGVGPLLFPAMVESDVVITNGRGTHAIAMAEHTLGVMIAFTRRLHVARDAQAARRWILKELWASQPSFGQLEGTTLGLVGLGAVGSAIAKRARALGVRVLAVRRNPASDPAPADAQWGPGQLDALIAASDWLVLVTPLTDETRGLIDRRRLALMKPGAVLINIGRGALVDEQALTEALEAGRLGGAALDVFEAEPLPESSPLWSMPQVIVTPHVSGLGPRYWERAVGLFRRNLDAFLEGRALENVVDKRAGY